MTPEELRRFHAGEHELFRGLVELHSPRLLSLARAYAADSDEAHDLMQETWVRAYAKRASYAGRGSILGWLLAVCRSVCASHHRSPAAVRAARQRQAEPRVEGAPGNESPERDFERAALGRLLVDALVELPERQREAVVLRLIEGRSTREAARVMGCAEGTVKASLHAALRKLRERLAPWSPSEVARNRLGVEQVGSRPVGGGPVGGGTVRGERR